MSRKKFMVFDKDNVHEYNIVVTETSEGVDYSLFRSENEQWNLNCKGELVLSMFNDGNGLIFNKRIKKIDYGISFAIRLLLNFENFIDSNETNKEKVKIIENIVIAEL